MPEKCYIIENIHSGTYLSLFGYLSSRHGCGPGRKNKLGYDVVKLRIILLRVRVLTYTCLLVHSFKIPIYC